jgi:ferredoxin
MAYDHLTCYFHSGTGNSYQAAKWLAESAADQGIDSQLIPIDQAHPTKDQKPGSGQLVGICHPTHGLMPTWSMIKFLFRLPLGHGAHAVVIATRGALPMGRVVVPGAAGLALFFPWLILLIKGYVPRGGLGLDMPSNLTNLHWGFSPGNVAWLMARARLRHARMADRVLAGRGYWQPLNLIYELAWCIPFAIWPLIPLGYLLVGRVFMAKLMFTDKSCAGCGRCSRNCPSKAIIMKGPKSQTPFWTRRCEVCLRCMNFCKFQAVQASHLWIAPVILATSWISSELMQQSLDALLGIRLGLFVPAYEAMAFLLTYICLAPIYYVFWHLLRLGPLRRLFSLATFTSHYSRRYHAPDVTPRQMNARSEISVKSGS